MVRKKNDQAKPQSTQMRSTLQIQDGLQLAPSMPEPGGDSNG